MPYSRNILSRMQQEKNGINYGDKNKTEIKEKTSDWDNDKLRKEILKEIRKAVKVTEDWDQDKLRTESLIALGYDRNGANHLSPREKLRQIHANSIILQKRNVHYKYHSTLHKGRAEAYRWKLEQEGIDPKSTVEDYFAEEDHNMDDQIKENILQLVKRCP